MCRASLGFVRRREGSTLKCLYVLSCLRVSVFVCLCVCFTRLYLLVCACLSCCWFAVLCQFAWLAWVSVCLCGLLACCLFCCLPVCVCLRLRVECGSVFIACWGCGSLVCVLVVCVFLRVGLLDCLIVCLRCRLALLRCCVCLALCVCWGVSVLLACLFVRLRRRENALGHRRQWADLLCEF